MKIVDHKHSSVVVDKPSIAVDRNHNFVVNHKKEFVVGCKHLVDHKHGFVMEKRVVVMDSKVSV